MIETLRSVASLLLSFGLLLMANGLFGTLLGVRAAGAGFSTLVVGVIMAGYFVGLLAGGRYAVHIVARVGHIRAFAAFASIMSTSALMHAMWADPVAWFVLRMMAGFCMAGMILVTESWLNERAVNETRGQVLAFYMITNYFAAGCGQFLLPLGDPAQFELFSVASIIFSLALVPVLLTKAAAPRPAAPQIMKIRDLYTISPMGFMGVLSAGLCNAAFYAMAPVFSTRIGLTGSEISIFMASAIMGGLLLQWPIGKLSDRVDRRWVLAATTLLTAGACAGLVFFAPQGATTPLFISAAIYGSISFTVYSVSAAHINDFADKERLIQIATGMLITYGIGASVGPIIAALTMSYVGPAGLFMYLGTISGLLGIYAIYRMTRRAARAHKPFIVVPTSSFSSEGLYTAVRDQADREMEQQSDDRK